MSTISANELKTRGVSALEAALQDEPEATITVRGRKRFVVMELEHYQYLRECELEAALLQAQADIAAGRVVDESVEAHVKRVSDGV